MTSTLFSANASANNLKRSGCSAGKRCSNSDGPAFGSGSIRPTTSWSRTTTSILAVGRDFSDVSPVDGIIVGSRKQKLAGAVDVLLVE